MIKYRNIVAIISFDLSVIAMFIPPIMYAIGKLRCFFGGCCYGIECNLPISVVYLNSAGAPNNINLFPVQLIECVVNLGIFLLLILVKKDDRVKIGWAFILCSLSKFILDFFRASWAHNISINQWISILVFIIGINIILINSKKQKET